MSGSCEAQGRIEALLVKLAIERLLSDDERAILGAIARRTGLSLVAWRPAEPSEFAYDETPTGPMNTTTGTP